MRAKKLTARLSMPAAIAPAELLVQSSWFRGQGYITCALQPHLILTISLSDFLVSMCERFCWD